MPLNGDKKSKIWEKFGFIKICNQILTNFAACYSCKEVLKYDSNNGTSGLSKHAKRCTP